MFALFCTFLYINDVKKLAKPQRSSLRIHLCASERSERAIFGVFNSVTVKKVNFFTINVKFKVILSSKSGGGGGGYIPPSPGIYASVTNHIHVCNSIYKRRQFLFVHIAEEMCLNLKPIFENNAFIREQS